MIQAITKGQALLILGLSLIILIYCLSISSAYAGSPPVQLTPTNNSLVSTSTLTWQIPDYPLFSSSPYRIQVDEEQNFADPQKDHTTSSTSYSPQLNNGAWYWRVKAKNEAGEWSDWSSVWQFALGDPTPQPTPTPTLEPTPSPSSTSTPTPYPSTSPTSSPSSTSEYLISSLPSEIDSNKTFSATISLKLPSNPNSNFYLKGAFAKSGSSNYFGQTKVNSSWIKNSTSYSEQKQITTDGSGTWSGKIEFMVDPDDSGFTGSAEYIFKVGRYSFSGSGPTWSNQVNIYIEEVEHEATASLNASTNPTPKTTPRASENPNLGLLNSNQATPEGSLIDYQIATVAGITLEATPTAIANITKVAGSFGFNFYLLGAGLLTLLAGGGSIVYITKRDWILEKFNR